MQHYITRPSSLSHSYIHTFQPSLSLVPTGTPTVSSHPSSAPSEYPTFNIGDLEDYFRIQSPGTTAFQIQHGLMFDIEAKDYDITIRNFRIPFVRASESVTISIWVRDGPFGMRRTIRVLGDWWEVLKLIRQE
jgi:hypothetical protein